MSEFNDLAIIAIDGGNGDIAGTLASAPGDFLGRIAKHGRRKK